MSAVLSLRADLQVELELLRVAHEDARRNLGAASGTEKA